MSKWKDIVCVCMRFSDSVGFFYLIFIKLLRWFTFCRVEMVLSTFRRGDRVRGNSSFYSMASIARGTIPRKIFILISR